MMGTELEATQVMAVYFFAVAVGGAGALLIATGVVAAVRRARAALSPSRRIRAATSVR